MKTNKLLVTLVVILLVLVVILTAIVYNCCFKQAFEAHIPDYNYRVAQLVEHNHNQQVKAKQLYAGNWDKVCFLGPYTLDVSNILGFDWNIDERTDVLSYDSHNVLVFVKNNEVLDFIIQNRSKGDFWKLSGQCLTLNKTLAIHKGGLVVAVK